MKKFTMILMMTALTAVLCLSVSANSLFADGDGSSDDPYQIATEEQLIDFRDHVSGGNDYKDLFIILTNDIELENYWIPIGYGDADCPESGAPFNGTFDGNGFTVSGVKIEFHDGHYVTDSVAEWVAPVDIYEFGFFGYVGESGIVRNLNVESHINIDSESLETDENSDVYIGVIAANVNGEIVNCSASGEITIDGLTVHFIRAGGLIGYLDNGSSVADSSADVEISINDLNSYSMCVGGLIGHADLRRDMEIADCIASGNISFVNIYTDLLRIGGLIGNNSVLNDSRVTVSHCASSGNIVIERLNIRQIIENNPISVCPVCGYTSLGVSAGGLIGFNHTRVINDGEYPDGNIIITECYSEGDLTVNDSGAAYSNDENTYAYIDLGGFIGFNEGNCDISNCYSDGDVLIETHLPMISEFFIDTNSFIAWAEGTPNITDSHGNGSINVTYRNSFNGVWNLILNLLKSN